MGDNPSTPVVEPAGSAPQDPSPLSIQMMQREVAHVKELLMSEIDSLRQHVVTRLEGNDKALAKAENYPTDIDLAVRNMREYIDDKMQHIDLRFTERDHRFDIRDEGNKSLLEEQRRSAREAITKAEDSVSKQLDSQQRQIDGLQRTMDKGEGKTEGAVKLWGIIVAAIMVSGTIVAIIATLLSQGEVPGA